MKKIFGEERGVRSEEIKQKKKKESNVERVTLALGEGGWLQNLSYSADC